jgi:hypothetical protein
MGFTLDSDKLIPLDAEDLAESGIKKAYDSIRSELSRFVPRPAEVQEAVSPDAPRYVVKFRGKEYAIYSPELPDDEGKSWGRAAHAFFSVVNDQLTNSEYRLSAINGGNDLFGIFLTQRECEAARQSQVRREDWPYLPTLEHPWYGQPHRESQAKNFLKMLADRSLDRKS